MTEFIIIWKIENVVFASGLYLFAYVFRIYNLEVNRKKPQSLDSNHKYKNYILGSLKRTKLCHMKSLFVYFQAYKRMITIIVFMVNGNSINNR